MLMVSDWNTFATAQRADRSCVRDKARQSAASALDRGWRARATSVREKCCRAQHVARCAPPRWQERSADRKQTHDVAAQTLPGTAGRTWFSRFPGALGILATPVSLRARCAAS